MYYANQHLCRLGQCFVGQKARAAKANATLYHRVHRILPRSELHWLLGPGYFDRFYELQSAGRMIIPVAEGGAIYGGQVHR